MITPFPSKSTPEILHDFGSKRDLLYRFTSQIAPSIHEQTNLLCSSLSLSVVQRTLTDLYLKHISIKTDETAPPNRQLDYIFHAFTPTTEASGNPQNLDEVLNLIQTGDKTKSAPGDAPGLFPAPIKDLPEIETALNALLVEQILTLCTELTIRLAFKSDETPIEDQTRRMLRQAVETLSTFLPEESKESKDAEQPGIPAQTASEETRETTEELISPPEAAVS